MHLYLRCSLSGVVLNVLRLNTHVCVNPLMRSLFVILKRSSEVNASKKCKKRFFLFLLTTAAHTSHIQTHENEREMKRKRPFTFAILLFYRLYKKGAFVVKLALFSSDSSNNLIARQYKILRYKFNLDEAPDAQTSICVFLLFKDHVYFW